LKICQITLARAFKSVFGDLSSRKNKVATNINNLLELFGPMKPAQFPITRGSNKDRLLNIVLADFHFVVEEFQASLNIMNHSNAREI
jgi:hypothetical protein